MRGCSRRKNISSEEGAESQQVELEGAMVKTQNSDVAQIPDNLVESFSDT
jgi:hypothetical protein